MKLRTVIIDDEPKLRAVLKVKLETKCPNLELVGMAEDAKSGYELIQSTKPNLVFLDIAMPGDSGFDLLQKFETIDFDVIFVTGFSEYILDALRVSAIDYLLKPVQNKQLIEAVEKAVLRKKERDSISHYHILKHNLNHIGDQKTKIAFPGVEAYEFVTVENIIRLEGWNKYTRVYLTSGKVIVSSYNIGVYRKMLSRYEFFNCHKSHMVNSKHIKRYLREGTVVMVDDAQVPVSRRKKDEFLSAYIKTVAE